MILCPHLTSGNKRRVASQVVECKVLECKVLECKVLASAMACHAHQHDPVHAPETSAAIDCAAIRQNRDHPS